MNMHEIDISFPTEFECTVVTEFPGDASALQYFPEDRAAGQDGLLVRVRPAAAGANAWYGLFAFGKWGGIGCTRVLSMPNPERFCVVANGAGYIVDVTNPEQWFEILTFPILHVVPIRSAGIIVFADHTEMLAYDRDGEKWRTTRLAWDGLKIVSHDSQVLKGEYADLEDTIRRFDVDLDTGSVRFEQGAPNPFL